MTTLETAQCQKLLLLLQRVRWVKTGVTPLSNTQVLLKGGVHDFSHNLHVVG